MARFDGTDLFQRGRKLEINESRAISWGRGGGGRGGGRARIEIQVPGTWIPAEYTGN